MSPLLRVLNRFWFQKAPPERPALLRLILGAYVFYYLGARYRMLLKVAASDPKLFKPVGIVSVLKKPLPVPVFRRMLVATFLANVAFMLGIRHRYTGPVFAGLLLWVLSYRNSWSMIYHNDNALVLHALILGLTPSADALSLDALDRAEPPAEAGWRYGWPVKLMSTVTALTYFLAGVAKVAGPLGWRWGDGEALRAQVMVDGLRKELLGDEPAPLAYALHDRLALFKAMGYGSLLLEVGASAALFDGRLSRLWAFNAFAMHWGIYFIMKIKFRYQLSGLIFASFFDLDRALARLERWVAGGKAR